MLPDRHCDGKVVVSEIWPKILVRQHNIKSNDGILRSLRSLEKHVDVDVLNSIKLGLCGLDLIWISWLGVVFDWLLRCLRVLLVLLVIFGRFLLLCFFFLWLFFASSAFLGCCS